MGGALSLVGLRQEYSSGSGGQDDQVISSQQVGESGQVSILVKPQSSGGGHVSKGLVKKTHKKNLVKILGIMQKGYEGGRKYF